MAQSTCICRYAPLWGCNGFESHQTNCQLHSIYMYIGFKAEWRIKRRCRQGWHSHLMFLPHTVELRWDHSPFFKGTRFDIPKQNGNTSGACIYTSSLPQNNSSSTKRMGEQKDQWPKEADLTGNPQDYQVTAFLFVELCGFSLSAVFFSSPRAKTQRAYLLIYVSCLGHKVKWQTMLQFLGGLFSGKAISWYSICRRSGDHWSNKAASAKGVNRQRRG